MYVEVYDLNTEQNIPLAVDNCVHVIVVIS